MIDPASDNDLVKKAQSGLREAYAELIRRHHPKVIGHCWSYLGNYTEAEDAAQDVFIKAYQSLPSFRKESSFATWIYTIASRHCLDLLRTRKRRREESWESLVENEGEKLHSLFARLPGEGKTFEEKDLAHRLLTALPEDYRVVLILREIQGFSYEEMARLLGWTLDSVKGRLKRARRDLVNRARHFLPAETVNIRGEHNDEGRR